MLLIKRSIVSLMITMGLLVFSCFYCSAALVNEIRVLVGDAYNLDRKITLPEVPKEYGKLINLEETNINKEINGVTLPFLILNLTFENATGGITYLKYEISREGFSSDPDSRLILRKRWVYQFERK